MLIGLQKLEVEAFAADSYPPCKDHAIHLVQDGCLPVLVILCLGIVLESLLASSNALCHSSLLSNQHHLHVGLLFLCIEATKFLLECRSPDSREWTDHPRSGSHTCNTTKM
jgi:hypothetical protein